jgi:hypothetical protein
MNNKISMNDEIPFRYIINKVFWDKGFVKRANFLIRFLCKHSLTHNGQINTGGGVAADVWSVRVCDKCGTIVESKKVW